jgi:hypothetical protein
MRAVSRTLDVAVAGQRMLDEYGVVAPLVEASPRLVRHLHLGQHTAAFQRDVPDRHETAVTDRVALAPSAGHDGGSSPVRGRAR